MNRVLIGYVILLLLSLPLVGCDEAPEESEDGAEASVNAEVGGASASGEQGAEAPAEGSVARPSGPIQFVDATAEAGITFKHNSGAFGKKYMPETVGSGCAFLDFDNDGWQDVLLVNSKSWPGQAGPKSFPALYRNNRNGTFADVTQQAGLAVEIYGLGCAVADFDNDGNVDIYITALGPNRLFRNIGGGRFLDVTGGAGVGDPGFSTSAAWLDYDKDGKLDLFVCNYVEWSIETDLHCSLDQKNKSYCTPEAYKGQSCTLYRNRGNGSFENVTKRAGVFDPTDKALGVAVVDYDVDGWPDLFVANDTQPNRLYRNNGDGTFVDNAVAAGVAFSEAGAPRAGMGADAADFDNSGRPGIVVGNFTNELISLYSNEGGGLFIDESRNSGIGKASQLSLTFACFFFDYDLDGMLDLYAANGHVSDDIAGVQPQIKYAQPPHLFRNQGRKRFESVSGRLGAALQKAIVGRGAACGDYDNDGDLDLLVTENNGPARLLRNDGGNQNDVLRVKTVGSASNRDGIGAKVTARAAGAPALSRAVKTGSSYCSQSELPLTFGLAKAAGNVSLEIAWPSGRTETVADVAPNQSIVVQEGRGVVSAEPIMFARPSGA
jgi:hypothetical protein